METRFELNAHRLYTNVEISEQFKYVQELCESIHKLLNKIKIFYQSTQSAIEMKETHYFKDKISLTFSLTEQHLSQNRRKYNLRKWSSL